MLKRLPIGNGHSGKVADINLMAKMNGNRVFVDILETRISALVDTGATVSCVSADIVNKLGFSVDEADIEHIVGISGKGLVVRGKVVLPLNFKGTILKYEFLVIDGIKYPLLLGDDFLRDNQASIHYPSQSLHLHDGTITVALITTPMGKARNAKRVKIEPKTVCEIPVKLPEKFKNKAVLLEPSQNLIDSQLMGASCLVKPTKNRAVVQVINPNDHAVVLHRRVIVASISHIYENSLQSITDKQTTSSANSPKMNKRDSNHDAYVASNEKADAMHFDLSNSGMTTDEQKKVHDFLNKHRYMFNTDLSELGETDVYHHEIDTGNNPPVRCPPYRASPQVKAEIERQTEEMLKNNIIEPSTSVWNSPVVLVRKRDGKYRFAVDYRRLNRVTKPISYPLPNLNDVFDAIGQANAQYFSTLDLSSGFWQIPLHENSKHKSAFVTHEGVFQWRRMPFGLMNAPMSFQMVMSQVLRGLHWKNVLVYVDDILIFSHTLEEHLQHLSQVFDRLHKANLTLKPSKCQFCVKSVKYLGHVLSKDGVQVDDSKVKIVREHPVPKDQKQVRQFLGLCNYYRKFLQNYAKITVPLNALLQNDTPFEWNNDCQSAFETLKNALTTAPILAYPDMSKPFVLTCDASGTAIGYILGQLDAQNRRACHLLRRSLFEKR